MIVLGTWFVFAIFWMIVCAMVAGSKGYTPALWILAAFFFGPFALLAIACMGSRKNLVAPVQVVYLDSAGNRQSNKRGDTDSGQISLEK